MDFLVLGYFRSGTTLVSNIINTNKKSHCVVDPFIYFMKIYRNKIYEIHNLKNIDTNRDLEDYLVYGNKRVYRFILKKADLHYKISNKEKREFLNNLIIYKSYQHPLISSTKNITANNYYDLLNKSLEVFYKLSKNKNKHLLGTKISWSECYINVFLRSNPELKIISVVRDVRSIINSANNFEKVDFSSPKRPFLYHITYWKSSIKNINLNYNKILLVKYEDIVKNFERQKNIIYQYLGINNKRKITFLKDQYGLKWKSNSSFYQKKNHNKVIFKKNNNKIPKSILRIIEFLCFDELSSVGYEISDLKKFKKNYIIKELKKIESVSDFDIKYKKWFDYEKILNVLLKEDNKSGKN